MIIKYRNYKINVNQKLVEIYNPSYKYIVTMGGRGGGKTYDIAEMLIAKSQLEKHFILCARETQKSMKESVYRVLKTLINQERIDSDTNETFTLSSLFEFKKDSITCLLTGSEFVFYGIAMNPDEVKGLPDVSLTWCEEAERISAESWDVLLPSIFRIKSGSNQLIISFNPRDEQNETYQRFVIHTPPNSLKVHINYDDNPFCPESLKELAEYDKAYNPDKYRHIWLGECKTMSNAVVFKNRFIVEEFEYDINFELVYFNGERIKLFYGLDFGFSNDPLSYIEMFIHKNILYITNELYGIQIEVDHIKDQAIEIMPYILNSVTIADSARPDTISQLARAGINVKGANKGKGSVEDGIEFMKTFEKIVIHPRCKNTIYEFETYSYVIDKNNGTIYPEIVDKNNHSIDAIRYGLNDLMKQGGSTVQISSEIFKFKW